MLLTLATFVWASMVVLAAAAWRVTRDPAARSTASRSRSPKLDRLWAAFVGLTLAAAMVQPFTALMLLATALLTRGHLLSNTLQVQPEEVTRFTGADWTP